MIKSGATSNERGTVVSHAYEEKYLTCLWELADGTEARVVEHPSAPRWELCVVRRGQIVQRQRCVTISELIARSTAFYASTTGMN